MRESASDQIQQREVPDDPPPFLGSWGRVYAAVLGYLAVLIFLFYVIGAAVAP